MISVVTGTLNRKEYLQKLLDNTVNADERIELVLVDGGSKDGTIKFIKEQNNPRIKLIEIGVRSPYPHYMNVGIQHASHDLICQWNDDVLLCNTWQEVIDEIDDDHQAYLFNWKTGNNDSINDSDWLKSDFPRDNGWIVINNIDLDYPLGNENKDELCMNYGIYRREVFEKVGGYNISYLYYYSDAEMANRAYYAGFDFKNCLNIKVCVLPAEKRAVYYQQDMNTYLKDLKLYQEVSPRNK